MFGQDERTYTDEHNQCRDDNRLLIGGQKLAPISIFVTHALGDEYGIVVALPKDESGENDIDNIKLNVEQ